MSKLFSQDCSNEYREKILAKVDEAHENGCATFEEDGEVLQFAEVDGDIIIEDQSAEPMEVTKLSANPEDENDLIATAVEIPAEEVPADEEVRTESDADSKLVSSIEINRIPGPDGDADDLVDDLTIDIEEGIESKEKSGTFSIRFKNVSEKYARAFAKVFSAMESELDKIVDSANVDEDVEVKFEGEGKMKVMSITVRKSAPVRTFSDGSEDEIPADEAEEKKQFEEGFKEGEEFEEGKESAELHEEQKEQSDEQPAEESTEDPTEEPEVDVTSVLDSANELVELVGEGVTKENAAEVKEKAEAILVQAEKLESNGAKMGALKAMCNKYSEECAACLDAAEEVVEEEKEFSDSDPKITLTVENLEPASVSQLLKPAGFEPEVEKEPDYAPVVDPNSEEQGRQFSLKSSASVNPYLRTEIK